MAGVRMLELTRAEVTARGRAGAVCLLPVGSLEQHGNHLPIGTDSLLVEHVCVQAAGRARQDTIVAPTLWAGLSPHHVRLGPTVTLEPELALQLTRSIVRSLRTWLARVVVVNGHGGNRGWLEALGLVDECDVVSYWELVADATLRQLFPCDLGSVGHAGQVETSAMLHAFPALVHDAAGEPFEPILRENDGLRLPDMGASGVLGDPSSASPQAGASFVAAAVQGLADLLDGLPVPQPPPEQKGHSR